MFSRALEVNRVGIREQAIKIEQIKNERDEAKNALFIEILSVSREIDSITNEMFKLGDKRKNLYDKLSALKAKQKRDEAHYDLVIKAYQSLTDSGKEMIKNE